MENSIGGHWSWNSDVREKRKKFRRFLAGPVTVVASITQRSLILEVISRIEGRLAQILLTKACCFFHNGTKQYFLEIE